MTYSYTIYNKVCKGNSHIVVADIGFEEKMRKLGAFNFRITDR